MDESPAATRMLHGLVRHLRERRQAILRSWQRLVDGDPQLTTASSLPKIQFNDHIPEVLGAFERRLLAGDSSWAKLEAIEDQKEGAARHGLLRWQQGYNQRETAREWGHLQLALLEELETFGEAIGGSGDVEAMRLARRALARLIGDGVSESATQYAELRQSDAAVRAAELERALESLSFLEQQRAQAWREAAHDLRGNVGVLETAVAVLDHDAAPQAMRAQSMEVLRRTVQSLHALLVDLMNLSRLEAGQEKARLETIDVARTLRELCDSLRPLAKKRNLFLHAAGPGTLEVEGDSVKVVRIAQNLLLNALRYTKHGGVLAAWEACGSEARPQWQLTISDSGPGITASTTAPMAHKLEEATREGQPVASDAAESISETPSEPGPLAESAGDPTHGEGIGLTIVKRLCELLDASLELESSPEQGTTFRVTFPRGYAQR